MPWTVPEIVLPPDIAPVDVDGGVRNPCDVEEVLGCEEVCEDAYDVVAVPVFPTRGCVDVVELHADTASATAAKAMAQYTDRGIKGV
ncbi:MAG: hypothetical protein M1420_01775 [Actinobacteria bacterium]|nr:hypothetical protein [Actinomycetota bacterium]